MGIFHGRLLLVSGRGAKDLQKIQGKELDWVETHLPQKPSPFTTHDVVGNLLEFFYYSK